MAGSASRELDVKDVQKDDQNVIVTGAEIHKMWKTPFSPLLGTVVALYLRTFASQYSLTIDLISRRSCFTRSATPICIRP